MISDEQLYDFTDGLLPEEERVTVLNALKDDEALRGRYETILAAKEAVLVGAIRERVGLVHQQFVKTKRSKPAPVRSMRRYIILAAASVVLISVCLIGIKIYSVSAEQTVDRFMATYTISDHRSGNSKMENAEKLYREKKFDELIRQNIESGQSHQRFLRGLSFLHLERYRDAEAEFESLKADPQFTEDAEYYLAFSYLGQGRIDKAKASFEDIKKNPSHLYSGQISEKLISELYWLSWKN